MTCDRYRFWKGGVCEPTVRKYFDGDVRRLALLQRPDRMAGLSPDALLEGLCRQLVRGCFVGPPLNGGFFVLLLSCPSSCSSSAIRAKEFASCTVRAASTACNLTIPDTPQAIIPVPAVSIQLSTIYVTNTLTHTRT